MNQPEQLAFASHPGDEAFQAGITSLQGEGYLAAVGKLLQRFGEAALRMGDLLDPASELPDRPPQFLLGAGVIIAGIRAANGDAIPRRQLIVRRRSGPRI